MLFRSMLLAPFRASGRFLWPVWYVVAAGAVVAAQRTAPLPGGRSIFLALLALQVVDLGPLWAQRVHYTDGESPLPDYSDWAPFVAGADTLQTYPPLAFSLETPTDALLFSYIGFHFRVPVTCAYVARRSRRDIGDYRAWLRKRLLSRATPRTGERIVIRTDSLSIFIPSLEGRYHLYRVGQYWIASGEEIAGFSEELPGVPQSE